MKTPFLALSTAVGLATLTSCSTTGMGISENPRALDGLASTLGTITGTKAAAQLDTYLAGPMKSKLTMERVGRNIRRNYQARPQALLGGQQRYLNAANNLLALRNSVKSDIDGGIKGPSDSTTNLVRQYNDSVQNLINYEASLTGVTPKSFGLLGALTLARTAFSSWNNYQETKQEVLKQGVDNRLTPTPFSKL